MNQTSPFQLRQHLGEENQHPSTSPFQLRRELQHQKWSFQGLKCKFLTKLLANAAQAIPTKAADQVGVLINGVVDHYARKRGWCAGYRLQCREKRSGLKQQLRNWRTPARYVRKRTVARLRLLFSFFYISLLARSRPSSSCSWILENGGWRCKARLREWQRWENKWVDGNDSFCCCHVKLGRESLREKI